MKSAHRLALLAIAAIASESCAPPAGSRVTREIEATVRSEPFGRAEGGGTVLRHVLTNSRGTIVELTDHGAAIVRFAVRGADGGLVDIVLSPPSLAELRASNRRFGAIVGRYAGRLGGSVTIDGVRYPLATNTSGVTLHGGDPGFDRATWRSAPFETRDAIGVTFRHTSPDGDQRFPGTLTVTARYALSRRSDRLTLDITAESDRPTVANVTNHVYFNLAGVGSVRCHRLRVDAARYVELDARKLPTGRLPAVDGTALDFRRSRSLNGAISTGGVDDMVVMSGARRAELVDPASDRTLTLTTDQPGIQIYTGNAFDGSDRDRLGRPIERHAGIALEPGHFADSPAHARFPSTRVAPGHPLRWHAAWTVNRRTPVATACRP